VKKVLFPKKTPLFRPKKRKVEDDGSEWISVSDLMTGLMLVFLFISVIYMMAQEKDKNRIRQDKNRIQRDKKRVEHDKKKLEVERRTIREIAVTFRETQNALYSKLAEVLGEEQKKGFLTVRRNNLSVSFHAPPKAKRFFFRKAACNLPKAFQRKLTTFFPTYLGILYLPKFRNQIEEIRIEGHTSSEGIYLSNMRLSQCRARAVLRFLLQNVSISKEKEKWLRKRLSVNGLSSSRVIKKPKCDPKQVLSCEDRRKSRRVTFRVKTLAEQKIVKILETLKYGIP